MIVFGVDIGARYIYTSGGLLLINVIFISLFYKELKIATFDPMLASVLGFSPVFVHYGLMTLVSLTAVGAFEAVGSILVVSFMIGPPVTAYLLTEDLKVMLLLSAGFGAVSGVLGYQIASLLDISIAGSMAVTIGLIFAVVFIFAPKRGLISILVGKRRQRKEFAQYALLIHICNHENKDEAKEENALTTISSHLHWDQNKLMSVLMPLESNGQVEAVDGILTTTQKGRESYRKFINTINIR